MSFGSLSLGRLSLGRAGRAPGAGGGAAPFVLRSVSPDSALADLRNTFTSSGYEDTVFAMPVRIGSCAVNRIVLSFNAWTIGSGLSGDGIILPTYGYRVKELYLVHKTEGYVQATLGGQTAFNVPAGTNDLHADVIVPSDFNLDICQEGEPFILKGRATPIDINGDTVIGEVATIDNKVAAPPDNFKTLKAAEDQYPTAKLTNYGGVSNDASAVAGGFVPPIAILGTFADDAEPPVYMGIGDSIFASSLSHFARALFDDFANPRKWRAGLNAGRNGGVAECWSAAASGDARNILIGWSKYCNNAAERYGVNGGTLQGKRDAWSGFKAADRGATGKTPQVHAILITGRTTSTDGWATLGNQSFYSAATGPSGSYKALNDATIAEIGVNADIDGYLDITAYRGGTDPTTDDYWKWGIAGGPNTTEGLHPNNVGNENGAAQLRPYLSAIEAAWDPLPTGVPYAFRSWMWSLSNPASDGDLSVTISQLPDDHNATITSIWYSLDGGSLVDSGGTTSFTIPGLTNGIYYDVRLYAENSEGICALASDVKSERPTFGEIVIFEDLFDTDTSSSYTGTDDSVSGGQLVLSPAARSYPQWSRIWPSLLTAGHQYRIEWSTSGPNENFRVGSNNGGSQYANINNQAAASGKSVTFIATGTYLYIYGQSYATIGGANLYYDYLRVVDLG